MEVNQENNENVVIEEELAIQEEQVTEPKKIDFKDLPFHKRQEEIVDILCAKTGSQDKNFFRVMVAYKFAEMATNMRATVEYLGTSGIPCNMYALDLAPSGYSKNASMNILDKEIFRGFKDNFMLKTMNDIKDTNIGLLASDYSVLRGIDIGDACHALNKEYDALPKFLYSFGSSTPEGFKASRAKLSMAGIGATSNIVDEIGLNLTGNQETMTVQLEAYDMGDSKQKLIKTDGGNSDLRGCVPSNLFAFGTQSKLLDGGLTEKQFFELLETGYARRFIVGFVDKHERQHDLTAEEMYDQIVNPIVDSTLATYQTYYSDLANKHYVDKKFTMSKDVALRVLNYRRECDKIADNLKEHEELLKAVIKHAYWRAIKIAGAYAFADKASTITEETMDNAIALVEMGIDCFRSMLSREKPYERLAKYIAQVERKVTQVDLVEDLVFYRGSEQQKRELMQLAIAYGYNNNIIIKRTIKDGIEFLEGETLKETDINKVKCSWSRDMTLGYKEAIGKFDNLHQMISENGFEYCNHSFKEGHRKGENAIEGFNLLILDVDSGLPIEVCKTLLGDYKFLIATTKRHTADKNRYRIVLPMSHELKLDPSMYKKFMENIFQWLPFDSDEQTKDIARKWSSFKGEYLYNEGKLFDVLPFIPETDKEARQRKLANQYAGVEHLQKWFLMNRDEDSYGRNNMLRDYALILLDDGVDSDSIRHSVTDFNQRLKNPLLEKEIESTIMKTVIRKELENEIKSS